MLDQPLPQLGWNMNGPHSALTAFLNTLPARPQLLAFGEPTHAVETFQTWRNHIFQVLVEDHGFRSIALESDVVAGLRVNAHVTLGQGTLDEAMQTGFSHGFGSRPANRELVEWMRDFNAGRDPEDHLHFYGFDPPLEWWAPGPRVSLLALHAFLTAQLGALPVEADTIASLCGEEERWTNAAAVRDASQSIGDSLEARRLRRLADDLAGVLDTHAPGLAAHPGFWEAQLHARTAVGLLQYHALLADPAPRRMERAAALRALLMADNLSAIAGCEEERGPTLVFAHNAHLQRHISTMRLGDTHLKWWSAGAHAHTRFGLRYALIASDLGTAAEKGIGEPAPGTLGGALMSLAAPATLMPAQALTAALPPTLAKRTDVPQQAGYFPLNAAHLALADGVLFLKHA
ncbi:erythromycin esterase family protein [Deinococcus hopiensis]|uniref:Erythromycin esterase homolog n=1 Tax=Deinococcus hopiensis KR-140 TaxID=695939 RepID=A0A1W1UDA2_9DEIO|nr:erythromycin esterase family protein [Deinococcus hopiensis]SMB79075.1 Erythromycin esterase homolog [Deinococcus hopiensis KR-140]